MPKPEAIDPRVPRKDLASLYRLAIGFIGIALILGVIGLVVLPLADKPIPQALVASVSAVAGGLVGVIAAPSIKGPSGN